MNAQWWYLHLFILGIVGYLGYVVQGFVGQCKGQNIGEKCLWDQDCYALNAVCGESHQCECGHGFQKVDAFNNLTIPYKCKAAPSKYGADCKSACKPPYVCDTKIGECRCGYGAKENTRDNTCECPAGHIMINRRCTRESNLGGRCSSHEECGSIPFAECKGRRCECSRGTRSSGSTCQPICGDGSSATIPCRTLFETRGPLLDVLEKSDTCPKGSACVTFGNPPVGVCCPMPCPYGAADLSKRCEPSATARDRCPSETHFCHKLKRPGGTSNSLCCPRPCREPNPVYVRGLCLPKMYEGDPCLHDEQCDGGLTMECKRNICQCRPGFEPNRRAKFPTCIKSCSRNLYPIGDSCRSVGGAGQQCSADRECTGVYICSNSVCSCPCGYDPVGRNGCLREAWAQSLPRELGDVPEFIKSIG